MKNTLYIILLMLSIGVAKAGFVENQGQFCDSVLYFAKTADCNIWLSSGSILFDYKSVDSDRRYGSAISVQFNAISKFNPIAKSPAASKVNFFLGSKSATNLCEYDSLVISELYSNIDLILYFKNGNFAYDFLLKPGANPDDIKLSIQGATSQQIRGNALILSTPYLEQRHSELLAYDNSNGDLIKSNFIFNNDKSISFKLEGYNRANSITIDPIVYSTFLGGSKYDVARAMELDSLGNVVIVGATNSIDYPTTVGSYDNKLDTMLNFYDVIISKFDSTGENLLFSTYLGGYGDDHGECLAIDKFGDIYISGYTFSLRAFPYTKGAIDTFDIGGFDVFLTKIKHSGDSLLFSTLFGGKGDDYAQGIALDKYGNVYLTGYTSSTDFRTTTNALDTANSGGRDGFAAKFSNDDYRLLYSTYFGGQFDDFGQTIAVDNMGGAVIGGITRSSDFPTSKYAFSKVNSDSVKNGSIGDAFLLKLNSSGSAIVFSTYLGGKGRDQLYGLCLDGDGNMYVTGLTESADFPIVAGAFDESYNNSVTGSIFGDIFVSKINFTGESLLHSTFIGGRGTERAHSISLDSLGNVYVVGTTTSPDFPVTRRAFQKKYVDSTDAFVSKLSPNLSKLLYSTYIGGKMQDVGNSIYPLPDFSVWVTGWTASPDFPTTANAFQEAHGDSSKSDVFLLRLRPNLIDLSFEESIGTNEINLCRGDSVYVGAEAEGGFGTLSYQWSPQTGLSSPDSSFSMIIPQDSQKYTLTVSDEFGNVASDTLYINVIELPKPIITGAKSVISGSVANYSVQDYPEDKYEWQINKGSIISGQGTSTIRVRWWDSVTVGSLKVIQTNTADCVDSATISVNIGKHFKPLITINGSLEPCAGDTVFLDAAEGYTDYRWSNGVRSRKLAVTKSGKYFVFASDSLGFSGYSDTLDIYFTELPHPEIIGQFAVKPNYIYSYLANGGANGTFTWVISGGEILSGQGNDSITVRWGNSPAGSLLLKEQTSNGCIGQSELVNIDIGGSFNPKIRVLGSKNICEGDTVLLDAGYGYSAYNWSNGETTRFISVFTADSFYCFVSDKYGFKGMTDTVVTKLLPRPEKPQTTVNGNLFICLTDSLPLQWYYNGYSIPGATNKSYIADIPGLYKVCVRGGNGCQSCSEVISYLVSVAEQEPAIAIYPNPAQDYLLIKLQAVGASSVHLTVYNVLGELSFSGQLNPLDDFKLDISGFSKGIYTACFQIANKIYYARFIKK